LFSLYFFPLFLFLVLFLVMKRLHSGIQSLEHVGFLPAHQERSALQSKAQPLKDLRFLPGFDHLP